MSDPFANMIQAAVAGSPVAAFLGAAVWYLLKQQTRWIDQLNKERAERLDQLERHVEECDRDRQRLSDHIINLLKDK